MENIPPSNHQRLQLQLRVVSAQEIRSGLKWIAAKESSLSDLCDDCCASFGDVVTWQGPSIIDINDVIVIVETKLERVEAQLTSSTEELAVQRKGYEALLATWNEELATQQKGYEAQLATQQKGYEAQLATQQKGYEAQLAMQRKSYDAQLATQRKSYEALLANWNEELATQRKGYDDLLKRQEDSFQKQLDSWIDEKTSNLATIL